MKMQLINHLVLVLASLTATSSSRILGIFPHGFRSHSHVVNALMEGLVERGHEVVVVSAHPRATTLQNYVDVSLVGDIASMTSDTPLDVYKAGEDRADLSIEYLFTSGQETCRKVLSLPKMKQLVTQKFDLVIYEAFNTDCFLGLVSQFNTPYIALSASAMMPWLYHRFGQPDNPSFIPFHFLPHSDVMSYRQRFKNTVYLGVTKWLYHHNSYLPAEQIAQEHLGAQLPSLEQVAKNTSLLLLNTHFTLNLPRPLVPAIVEVGGIHIRPHTKLPQNIQSFLDDAQDGVIYFSFGSSVKASTFPPEKRRALIAAFSQLPLRVLWKWEGKLPGKPDNVMVDSWLPQQSILKHPNVRVFMTHGGLLGTMEAVSAGVPMVAIPLFGDQPLNVAALVKHDVALRLDYPSITTRNVLHALNTVLQDPSYRENARRLSHAFNDRPLSAVQTAVYWTEYVIRHQGAPLLQVSSTQLVWYQYYLIDVLGPILFIVVIIVFITYCMLRKFLVFVVGFCVGNKRSKLKVK